MYNCIVTQMPHSHATLLFQIDMLSSSMTSGILPVHVYTTGFVQDLFYLPNALTQTKVWYKAKFGNCLNTSSCDLTTCIRAIASVLCSPAGTHITDTSRLAKHGMCLTKTGIYASCSADSMTMAIASGVKWQVNGVSSCQRRITSDAKRSVPTARLFQSYTSFQRAKPTIGSKPLRLHSVMMAAPGPGGGVLDRPAVLPGYDNK